MIDVFAFENDLRDVEGRLEELGRRICSERNGGESFSAVNEAISCVQRAIHSAYKMRFTTEEM